MRPGDVFHCDLHTAALASTIKCQCRLKNGRMCKLKAANATTGSIPLCGIHKGNGDVGTRCIAILDCGQPCAAWLPKIHGNPTICDAHRGYRLGRGLLDVPTEIRFQIFLGTRDCATPCPPDCSCKDVHAKLKINPALLLVNREISKEAQYLLYEYSVYFMETDGCKFRFLGRAWDLSQETRILNSRLPFQRLRKIVFTIDLTNVRHILNSRGRGLQALYKVRDKIRDFVKILKEQHRLGLLEVKVNFENGHVSLTESMLAVTESVLVHFRHLREIGHAELRITGLPPPLPWWDPMDEQLHRQIRSYAQDWVVVLTGNTPVTDPSLTLPDRGTFLPNPERAALLLATSALCDAATFNEGIQNPAGLVGAQVQHYYNCDGTLFIHSRSGFYAIPKSPMQISVIKIADWHKGIRNPV